MLLRKSTTMLTNNMPQSDHIVIARGWQAEGCRLLTASAVKIRMEWFDNVLPDKVEGGRQRTFSP